MPCFVTLSFSPKTPIIGCRESFHSANAFATFTIFKLSVLSLWTLRTIKWFSRQSEMVERGYVFTRFMAEDDRSLTALVAEMKKRIFASTMIWGTKVFVVALNDCTNSTSSFTLSIGDSGKYLRVSSCAFNSSPWSHLYTTEGLHQRVPQSPLLVGNLKTFPVYFWMRFSLFVR